MKKSVCALAMLLMLLLLAACGNEARTPAPVPSISPEAGSTQKSPAPEIHKEPAAKVTDGGGAVGKTVDVDLTALSSTMVYAEVYNMMFSPDEYIGKTVKMSGQFGVFAEKESGPYYFACVISDATACCQQGIEFVLADESAAYPKDYPKPGTKITVTGVFQTYEEKGHMYRHLVGAYFE